MEKEILKQAIEGAQVFKKRDNNYIDSQGAISQGLELVNASKICLLGTNLISNMRD
jgi:hypothetical protein